MDDSATIQKMDNQTESKRGVKRRQIQSGDEPSPSLRKDFPRILGTAEVAEILGVYSQNLLYLKGLPEPVAKLRATRVWLESEILDFARVWSGRRKRAA